MKNKYIDEYETPKPRTPHVKEKSRYKDDFEAIVEEEEHLLDGEDENPPLSEEQRNWLEYLEMNATGGKVTPKNEIPT